MKKFIIISVFLIVIFIYCLATQAADETYLVKKTDDGSILIMADGSIWEVDSVDRIDSSLWLPMEDIIIPDSEDCLINKDNGEKVDARRIR